MMTRYLIIIFWLALSLSIFFTSCDKDNGNDVNPGPPVEDKSYDVMKLGEIPIGLWVTPPAPYQNSVEYGKIKECGMNFINGFYFFENSTPIMLKVLDYCEEHKLKYFTSKAVVHSDILSYAKKPDEALLKKFINGIKPYANHPAFAGELLMDEPGKPLFDAVAAFTGAFEKTYPDKIAHLNLFPNYATGGIQANSYADYINGWVETVAPKHISYDNYPLLTDGTIMKEYYYNLDIVRAKSRYKKIPFWTFIQTLAISGTSGVADKREPSEADIRWQVWSSLAYGAKGIQYFCYWTPGSGTEQFGDALIDTNGNKTVRYDYVKKLNADINAIGKILLECDAEGVIQTAAKNYSVYAPLYSFGEIDTVSGDDNIVGCFISKEGKNKALITTLRPDKNANVTLHLSSAVKTVKVWRNEVSSTEIPAGNKMNFSISAGDAVLLEF